MTRIHSHRKRNVGIHRWGNALGFSMIEIILSLLVGSILTAIAIPQIASVLNRYKLQGAVASSTWAIQSTRYQALMAGYPYQVVFTASTGKYQIQDLPPGAASYANVGTAVPLSGAKVVLNQNTTLQFKPNGAVTATAGSLNFTLTFSGSTKTITVSNYGNINVTP
jgi:type II secretory pathway pseudopilin PulG